MNIGHLCDGSALISNHQLQITDLNWAFAFFERFSLVYWSGRWWLTQIRVLINPSLPFSDFANYILSFLCLRSPAGFSLVSISLCLGYHLCEIKREPLKLEWFAKILLSVQNTRKMINRIDHNYKLAMHGWNRNTSSPIKECQIEYHIHFNHKP